MNTPTCKQPPSPPEIAPQPGPPGASLRPRRLPGTFRSSGQGGNRGGRGDGHQGGFVLVGTLLIMLLLVLIGISATTSANLELQMARADRSHTETFFNAEGGLEVATFLLEENIICAGFDEEVVGEDLQIGPITVSNDSLNFWAENPPNFPNDVLDFLNDPDTKADIIMADFPWHNGGPDNQTSIRLGGSSQEVFGGAMQMAAGYVGVGKAAAASGTSLVYTMYVQHQGPQNTNRLHQIEWHTTGLHEGQCTVNN